MVIISGDQAWKHWFDLKIGYKAMGLQNNRRLLK